MGTFTGADGVRPSPYVHETHVGVVFLVGDRAYKIKKPVRNAFLDFSTAERRRNACRREVELNRRLAPDVYLGLAEITDPVSKGGSRLAARVERPPATQPELPVHRQLDRRLQRCTGSHRVAQPAPRRLRQTRSQLGSEPLSRSVAGQAVPLGCHHSHGSGSLGARSTGHGGCCSAQLSTSPARSPPSSLGPPMTRRSASKASPTNSCGRVRTSRECR